MSQPNPYEPVAVDQQPSNSDRPFYLYATAIVLLFWGSVFLYLGLNYELHEMDGMIYISFLDPPGPTYFGTSILGLVVVVGSSILFVNSVLWAVLALLRRFR